MAHETEFHVHHDSPEAIGRRERLGVRLLIVADGAFLFGMIFSWFYLRNLNVNQGWLPKGVHSFSTASGYMAALGLVVAALAHRLGEYNKGVRNLTAIVALVALLIGGYYQWRQMAHMPFEAHDANGRPFFNGAYASNWVLVAGANMFHYILGAFVALGLVIRGYRAQVDHTLEEWRQRTAGSWFTWIAVSGVLCAIATSFK
jgi:heme/copper-type cytochrome/quinol oxidase subunit 3